MNKETARNRLCGCYVTIPTMFRDEDLAVDLAAIRRHVRFLIEGGITTGTGVLLAGGAAGDFSTMTFEERVQVVEAVVEEANGRVPVVMGAQTTSTRELVEFARAAEWLGAEYIQVSPPYYFAHTEEDFYEHVVASAEAADVGLIIYNTFWTSYGISTEMVERLIAVPNVVGLKWSMPDKGNMEFEQIITRFADKFAIIDNQMRFVTSHMLGARGIEVHVCNYWPQWGVRLWHLLESHQYVEAQQELVKVAMPFLALWQEMEQYTSGDGYLDKLCMELVGLDSSRCRPPTRDVRQKYRERARQMLLQSGVPGVVNQ
ncbi:MAG: dihydrodipicolinate synthase family protein [Chloroflexi bacterium]|nr:dihydrodipicolinate synthase family protein [Chloroflexota bacterium]